ncbi:hypothetical protein ACFL3C_01175 [Patescibacteria group bacterium]
MQNSHKNPNFFYSKFVYYERLEPIIDKALAHLDTVERAAKNTEAKLHTDKLLEKMKLKAKEAQKKGRKEEVKKIKLLRKYVYLNNPKKSIKTPKVSPKDSVLYRIGNRKDAREAHMMFAIIEKYWGIDKAIEVHKKFWDGNEYKLWYLYEWFTENRAGKKIGFYYSTNIKKYSWVKARSTKLKMDDPWNHEARPGDSPFVKGKRHSGMYYNRKFEVTGWWTVDSNGDDEFTYSLTLKGAIKKIYQELVKDPGDSGFDSSKLSMKGGKTVSPYGEEIVKTLKNSRVEGELYDRDRKVRLFKYFHNHPKKRHHDKWATLENSKEAGRMVAVLGQSWENYLLRYSPKDKKIYVVSIQGRLSSPDWGYIDIKENKYKKGSWMVGGYNRKTNDLEFFKKEIIDKMSPSQVNAELGKIEQKNAPIVKGKEIIKTKDACAEILKNKSVYKVKAYFAYDQNEKAFFTPLKAALLTWVKANVPKAAKDEKVASKLVEVRMAKVRTDFAAARTANGVLDNALNSKPKTKVKVEFAENDLLKLDFHNTSLAGRATQKYQKVLKAKAEQAKKAAKTLKEKGFIGQIKRGLDKFFASMGGVFGKFGKYITGHLASMLGGMFDPATLAKLPLIGGFIGGSLAVVGLAKMRKKDFEKLTKGKTKHKFKKGYTMAEREYDLGSGKIILPDRKVVKGKIKKGFKIPKGSEWRAA